MRRIGRLSFILALVLGVPAFAQTINLQTQVRGVLPPANGGLGTQPTAADQIPIATSATVIAFEQMYNCASDGLHGLTYSTSTHAFACTSMTVGSPSWASVTNGASAATLTMASGGSLAPGAGTIAANYLNGVAICVGPSSATGYALITSSTTAACWAPFSGGSVTTFTAPAGSWPSWLVPTVTNATSTPNLAVAASAIPNSALANPSTTVNGQTCTLGASCTVPASPFSAITGGTNTSAAMVVGAGSSLGYTSTGTVNASSLGGVAANNYAQLSGSYNTFSNGNTFNSTVVIGAAGSLQVVGAPGNSNAALLPNATATSSANYGSPAFSYSAAYWNGTQSVYDTCSSSNAVGSGANPNMNFNFTCAGSSGTHSIGFGNPFLAPSVNYIVLADDQSGGDIAAKINAAFTSQAGSSGSPQSGVEVDLNPTQQYTVSATTLVIPNSTSTPYITRPVLDCKGSTITFTGHSFTGASTDAVTIKGENTFNSGEMRNCFITFSDTAATFHLYSRTFFKMTHNTFSLGATGITMYNGFTNGEPGYTEEQEWGGIEFAVGSNSCAVSFVNDPSMTTAGGSFFYNSWPNIHFDLTGTNSYGFCTVAASGSQPPPGLFGNTINAKVNTGGTGDRVFNLGNGTTIIRGTVNLSGEVDGSAACDVYLANSSASFANSGSMTVTGNMTHCFATAVGAGSPPIPRSQVIYSGGLDYGNVNGLGIGSPTVFQTPEPAGTNGATICKTLLGAKGSTFALAHPLNSTSNCYFQIGYRQTDNTYQDVDQPGASGNAFTNILWADDLSKNVGIGPGWSSSNEPPYPLTVNGTTSSQYYIGNGGMTSAGTNGTATCAIGFMCTATSGVVQYAASSVSSSNTTLVTLTPTVAPPHNMACTITPFTGYWPMWAGGGAGSATMAMNQVTVASTTYYFSYTCF